MNIVLIYIGTAAAFFMVDIIWLGLLAKNFYRKHLGPFFSERVNWPAAVLFYGIYIAGLLFFVIMPAIQKGSMGHAAVSGALFGLVTYATYDLTNLATLKGWPLPIVVVDMIWGTFLCSVTSVIGFGIASEVMKRFA
jgi:uncharacterized membrane protein